MSDPEEEVPVVRLAPGESRLVTGPGFPTRNAAKVKEPTMPRGIYPRKPRKKAEANEDRGGVTAPKKRGRKPSRAAAAAFPDGVTLREGPGIGVRINTDAAVLTVTMEGPATIIRIEPAK